MDVNADRSKLEAFEMWIRRRIEKISWVDKKTNEKILNMIEEDRKILNTIWCHKMLSLWCNGKFGNNGNHFIFDGYCDCL